ncbi:MAG: group intron reverse transcriptase/maturase [Pseudomonadota bacterium]|jgi:RNA-directed DNA polymerase
MTALMGRELVPILLGKIVGSVNRSLSGWANYFHYRNSNQALEKVKSHVEQRVRAHLMKRHKVKDRGIGEGRFPSFDRYGRYGLYKIPTKAGWKTAHA